MLKYVVLAGLILIHQSTHCMMVMNTQQAIQRASSPTSSTVISSQADPSSSPSFSANPEALLPQRLISALEQGNHKEVIALFSSRWNWIDSWQNYYTRLEHSLEYATRFPAKKTGPVVSFLLSEVQKKHLALPESLLKNAKMNGHTQVVEYLEKISAQKSLCPLPESKTVHDSIFRPCLPHEDPQYAPNSDVHGYIIGITRNSQSYYRNLAEMSPYR